MQSAREERVPPDYLGHIDDLRKQQKENFPMIDVVVIPPEGKPYPTQIIPSATELSHLIGGSIELLTSFSYKAQMLVDEDRKAKRLKFNPIGSLLAGMGIYDHIRGPMVVIGPNYKEGKFTSVDHDLKIGLLSIYAD